MNLFCYPKYLIPTPQYHIFHFLKLFEKNKINAPLSSLSADAQVEHDLNKMLFKLII